MSIQRSAQVAADCVVSTDLAPTDLASGNTQKLVTVVLKQASACRQCARGSGCGAGLLSTGQNAGIELQCQTDQSVYRGQNVTIEIDDPNSGWLLVVLIAFGLPILGLGFGLAAGSWSAWALSVTETADWPAAVGAFVGLTGGVLAWCKVAPIVDQRMSTGLCEHSARIVNICSDSSSYSSSYS